MYRAEKASKQDAEAVVLDREAKVVRPEAAFVALAERSFIDEEKKKKKDAPIIVKGDLVINPERKSPVPDVPSRGDEGEILPAFKVAASIAMVAGLVVPLLEIVRASTFGMVAALSPLAWVSLTVALLGLGAYLALTLIKKQVDSRPKRTAKIEREIKETRRETETENS